MGFTIEDMMVVSEVPYRMELVSGKEGWSNSISWLLMVEDLTILKNFTGKELAVTTGLGFATEERLLELARILTDRHAAGQIINTGEYILEIPQSLKDFCNENNLPLLTVPWDIYMSDLIKDMTVRIFLQNAADEQISRALIKAIEVPQEPGLYEKDLLPYFDIEGTYQAVLITTENLAAMDTVDRRRLAYSLHIFLEKITHNGNFFYFDGCFVLVMNNVSEDETDEIIEGFLKRCKRRLPDTKVTVGVGSQMSNLKNLYISYQRGRSALKMAHSQKKQLLYFDKMDLYRLLYSVSDSLLLQEMGKQILQPLIQYDENHGGYEGGYVQTLSIYLKSGGSIQAVSDKLFTHRNTVIYRLNKIRKLLNSNIDTEQERLPLLIACMILEM